MSQVREAMIVAGGEGTRLRPLTATTPKPLLPFCGAPFLEGVVRRLAAIGVERILLVVGADTAPFEPFARAMSGIGVDVATVPEPEPLDTAGGVRAALDRVGGTFLVLNGDILTDVDLAAAVAAHRDVGAAATIVLTRVPDTSTFGVCVRDGTRIVAFVEKPAPGTLPDHDTVNAGTYVLEPGVLERFPAGRLSFERQVFPGLVDAGVHVEGWVGDGAWADLGTPQRYLDGHRLALDGGLAWPALDDLPADPSGVRAASDVEVAPDALVRAPVLLASGARVGAGATVGPHAVLGQAVTIGRGARIVDTILGPRTSIGDNAHLQGVITGEAVRVAAGVRIPLGAVLGDGVVVPAGTQVPAAARIPDPGDE